MKYFEFELHHSEKELFEFEKKEKKLKVKERIRAIRLMIFSGYQNKLIYEMTGRGRTTILRWCHLYNNEKILGFFLTFAKYGQNAANSQ